MGTVGKYQYTVLKGECAMTQNLLLFRFYLDLANKRKCFAGFLCKNRCMVRKMRMG